MPSVGDAFELPPHLSERTRLLSNRPLFSSGEFVLYWMNTAIRASENPALDVAVRLADQVGLPVLIYHALSERSRYASDRHHWFVLEGARDVQAALAERGVSYVFHLERPGRRGPHLRSLTARAAATVTEDMPVEPKRRFVISLKGTAAGPIFMVDTACIVPLNVLGRAYDRAFLFRQATVREYDQRISQPWVDEAVGDRTWKPVDLPFEPVDLQSVDLAELISSCDIDHGIGPISDTRGGTTSGLARWEAFKRSGLAAYDRRRNDPLVVGVSRLSAYLHYGMVSPMQIAREAAAIGGSGAEKFLDEMLVWRELAYAFCRYRPGHARFSALPGWAQQTLVRHASDPRPQIHSWETLARGETGDAIWDAAQKSLLVHGELHNNVRMTWGKAILNWTTDPREALRVIIDLNHRFALDGQDPASYGGILWCLGQFDRPFEPERPIVGTVRPRPTSDHARRLDVSAYRRRTTRALFDSMPRVAVIGAGVSGLACARTLADHGLSVTVFEKSRGSGGRTATRRAQALRFDHGAQYFTARDPVFRRFVRSWQMDGVVSVWEAQIRILGGGGGPQPERRSTARFVGVPDMNAIAKHLGRQLDTRLGVQLAPPQRASEGGWQLTTVDGESQERFDWVLVSAPAPQAAELLQAVPDLAARAAGAAMQPCWAVMAAWDEGLPLDFDGAFVHDSPLAWVARNSSKPGRERHPDAWVLHASSEWTQAQLEVSGERVTEELLEAFSIAAGIDARLPTFVTAHRWRYALPARPLPSRCLFDADEQLGACGDWCGGPRIEGAFLSGLSLAGRVLGELNQRLSPGELLGPRQQELF